MLNLKINEKHNKDKQNNHEKKYEDQDYQEMIKDLPKMGSQVEYEGVIYRITSMNVMTNEARLENSERYESITLDELRENTIMRWRSAPIAASQRRTSAGSC